MARVLLVDDSESILRTLEIALERGGHEVRKTQSPAAALEAVAAEIPDIMIVDVMMPGGTEGFDLVWQIRGSEDEAVKSIPIVMATGIQEQTGMSFFPHLPDGLFEAGKPLDVQGWLDKPVNPTVLTDKISEVLGE